ncbi:Cell cycle serine/threonine-protein kinase cdc5/MSD2 [Dimargaris cristalligena]|nr:Cell cycle serine/threonine-protein kinase cdc5/MSD2 [Dimargaris cristalligena]
MAAVSTGSSKLKPAELAAPRLFNDSVWPHLPSVFKDKKLLSEYRPQKFIGAGAFGRVYSVVNDRGDWYACKVLEKQSFKNLQYRKRLLIEIETLRKLPGHPHIVGFVQCFEDASFVYIVMELCSSKSLDAVFKSRKFVSEPEVRYFMYQLIDAVEHMHKYKVIHRDLKFANILLTESMQVKVADFGLSAMLGSDTERKKSFLGTPNFLAPELVTRPKEGHSFEVDIWALGIVMYSMLYSKPPFHVSGGTKQAQSNALFQKITREECRFPDSPAVSQDAKNLILALLDKNPDHRPNAYEIRRLPFFVNYNLLPSLSRSVFIQPPEIADLYIHVKKELPAPNFQALPAITNSPYGPANHSPRSAVPAHPNALTTQFQQLQIDKMKPVSAPVHSPNGRLQLSPKPASTSNGHPQYQRPDHGSPHSPYIRGDLGPLDYPQQLTRPRITMPTPIATHGHPYGSPSHKSPEMVPSGGLGPPRPQVAFQHPVSPGRGDSEGAVTRPSQLVAMSLSGALRGRTQAHGAVVTSPNGSSGANPRSPLSGPASNFPSSDTSRSRKCSVMSSMETRFNQFFQDLNDTAPGAAPNTDQVAPKVLIPAVFISKWIDLSNKYGLGYELTNNSYGVHFNDNTTLLLLPDHRHIEHLFYDPTKSQKAIKRESHTLDEHPPSLKKKVTLLLQFRRYMRRQLHNTIPEDIAALHRDNSNYWYNGGSSGDGPSDNTPSLCTCGAVDQYQPATTDDHQDPTAPPPVAVAAVSHRSHCPLGRSKQRDPAFNLLYLNKFIRTGHAAMFRISHGVLQLNFIQDHSKLVIQNRGEIVTYISDGQLQTFTLSDLETLRPQTDLLKRLKYTRNVLAQINVRRSGNEAR